MTTLSIVLSLLAVVIVICTVLAFAWLFRTLKWQVVEDDELEFQARDRSIGWNWAKAWLKPRPRMLTYRRDALGRFRRHRR